MQSAVPLVCFVSDWAVPGAYKRKPRTIAAASAFAVTETAGDTLGRKLGLPEYSAVSLYVPGARDAVESVATPDGSRVPVPSSLDPFLKLTVPVGWGIL